MEAIELGKLVNQADPNKGRKVFQDNLFKTYTFRLWARMENYNVSLERPPSSWHFPKHHLSANLRVFVEFVRRASRGWGWAASGSRRWSTRTRRTRWWKRSLACVVRSKFPRRPCQLFDQSSSSAPFRWESQWKMSARFFFGWSALFREKLCYFDMKLLPSQPLTLDLTLTLVCFQ